MSDALRNPQGVFAQTRQGSEETLRISHLTHLRLRPRSQQTDFEQARALFATTREVHFVDVHFVDAREHSSTS